MKNWTLTLADEEGMLLDAWSTGNVVDREVFMALLKTFEVAPVTSNKLGKHLADTSEEINRIADMEPMS